MEEVKEKKVKKNSKERYASSLYRLKKVNYACSCALAITGVAVLVQAIMGWYSRYGLYNVDLKYVVVWGLSVFFCPFIAVCFMSTLENIKENSDPTNKLLLGVVMWGIGVVVQATNDDVWYDVGLGLIGAGAWLCTKGLKQLDRCLPALQALCNEVRMKYDVEAIESKAKCKEVYACFIALIARYMLVWCFPNIRLIMILMQLWCLAVLLFQVWHLPFNNRMMQKLERWHEDPQRHASMLPVLHRRLIEHGWHRPWGIPALIAVLRRLYPHKKKYVSSDAESLSRSDDDPVIYLANHGDVYGPVACMLHLSKHVRPWTISNIMVDKQETVEYIYKYDFQNASWLLPLLRKPAARLAANLSHWCMRSLDAVPVFRDHPHQLRSTFRRAVEALEEGDDMLIFPENPNAQEQDHGYEKQGVGTLFSGFAMLAPIYYNRTGKCCRFVPVFASKKTRSLWFGEAVIYQPGENPQEERDRLVKCIEEQMMNMYEEAEVRPSMMKEKEKARK